MEKAVIYETASNNLNSFDPPAIDILKIINYYNELEQHIWDLETRVRQLEERSK